LILAACFGLLYLFVFNFTLGSADWDLRSSSAPLFGLLGVYLFLTWGEKRSAASREDTAESKGEEPESGDGSAVGPFRSKRLKAWGLIFIWVGLFHTVPWVLINAHHQRSLNRYLLVQENDPHPVDETGFNLYKIARILRLADMPEEEEKLYLRAIDRDPYDTLSYFNLAAYYHTADRYDRAILVLDSLLRVDPSYPKANWMIGNIYVKRLEYEKALPYLEQVSGVLADNSDFLYDLGASYYSTDQPEKALTCGLQILQLTPDYTDAYHILGLSYYTLGDYDKAIGAWEHILSVNPDDSVAMQNLRELTEYLEKKTQ
jgi:tetratricopeptide (TPR) repeat protein